MLVKQTISWSMLSVSWFGLVKKLSLLDPKISMKERRDEDYDSNLWSIVIGEGTMYPLLSLNPIRMLCNHS